MNIHEGCFSTQKESQKEETALVLIGKYKSGKVKFFS